MTVVSKSVISPTWWNFVLAAKTTPITWLRELNTPAPDAPPIVGKVAIDEEASILPLNVPLSMGTVGG